MVTPVSNDQLISKMGNGWGDPQVLRSGNKIEQIHVICKQGSGNAYIITLKRTSVEAEPHQKASCSQKNH
jgi:hypothetical protein